MSLAEELAAKVDAAEKVAVAKDAPVKPGVRVEGGAQVLQTRPSDSEDIDWADQFQSWGLNPEEWTVVGPARLSVWEAQVKGGDIVRMHSWKAQVQRVMDGDAPTDVVLRQAEPVNITVKRGKRPPTPKRTEGWKTAVILPDAQRPTHDPDAVDVAMQILEDCQDRYGVDKIIHLGDDLDLPDFGKHRSAPEVLGKINEATTLQYRTLAYERAICPEAEIDWLVGNHEARLTNWMVDNAPQLLGLQRADTPQADPVLSIPYLCRLDELDVNYVDPWPEGEVWLNDHVRCLHGTIARSGKGATATAYLSEGGASSIYGHIHRKEQIWQTRHTKHGPRTYMAGSPGTLCDISGGVPSANSGITAYGAQGKSRTEDWQQGLWIVRYQLEGPQWFTIDDVNIWAGWGFWEGKHYHAGNSGFDPGELA
jgi:hypothetical protein